MRTVYSRIRQRYFIRYFFEFIDRILPAKESPLVNPPFFILGSGRNGSTLMASILNNHPDVFIPPEEYLLPFEIIRWKLYGRRNPRKFLDKMLARFLQKTTDPKWAIDGIKSESILSGLASDEVSFARIFDQVVRHYALSKGKHIKIWGDKTPILTHYIDYVYPVFPNSKYIFLIRNPKDVALSYLKMHSYSKKELLYGMWRWLDSVRTYDFLLKKNASVCIVKYEDLVTSPEQTFKSLQEFLNIEYMKEIAFKDRDADILGADRLTHLQKIKKAIDTDSVGRWKRELDDDTLNTINPLINRDMKRFGYE